MQNRKMFIACALACACLLASFSSIPGVLALTQTDPEGDVFTAACEYVTNDTFAFIDIRDVTYTKGAECVVTLRVWGNLSEIPDGYALAFIILLVSCDETENATVLFGVTYGDTGMGFVARINASFIDREMDEWFEDDTMPDDGDPLDPPTVSEDGTTAVFTLNCSLVPTSVCSIVAMTMTAPADADPDEGFFDVAPNSLVEEWVEEGVGPFGADFDLPAYDDDGSSAGDSGLSLAGDILGSPIGTLGLMLVAAFVTALVTALIVNRRREED